MNPIRDSRLFIITSFIYRRLDRRSPNWLYIQQKTSWISIIHNAIIPYVLSLRGCTYHLQLRLITQYPIIFSCHPGWMCSIFCYNLQTIRLLHASQQDNIKMSSILNNKKSKNYWLKDKIWTAFLNRTIWFPTSAILAHRLRSSSLNYEFSLDNALHKNCNYCTKPSLF